MTQHLSFHLNHMRQQTPLVQNITNFVAMNTMANVMLAAGASPAMVHAIEEAEEFAGIASALSINIGTLQPDWVTAMLNAAGVASAAAKPWVFDPVAAGATQYRRQQSERLLQQKPTVIRGNASEIMALAGAETKGRGADAADSVAAAESVAIALAKQSGAVVAVTGEIDFITDGKRLTRVHNGDAMMPKVTALGCSLTGIVAAFAVGADAFEATVAAIAYYGVAGEMAAAQCSGPGSFQVQFLDALYQLTPEQLDERARVTYLT